MKFLKLNIQLFASNSNSANVYAPASSTYPWVVATSWSETKISGNQSTITLKASLYGKNITFSGTGGTLELYWFDNNNNSKGKLVKSATISSPTKGKKTEISGTISVEHLDNGSLSGYSRAVWTKTKTNSYVPPSKTVSTSNTPLTNIPTYPEITSFSVVPSSETAVSISWKADSIIDYLWYSTNNGSTWTGKSVNSLQSEIFSITGLSPDTSYNFKIRLRRKESQLTKDSSAITEKTYSYPYILTATDNIIIGNKPTITLYNPLSRNCTVYGRIVSNSGTVVLSATTTGTSIELSYVSNGSTLMYNNIPSSTSGNIYYTLTYSSKSSSLVKKFSINTSECHPVFTNTNFNYSDINTAVTAITQETGLNGKLVQGLSKMRISITAATPKNGATISSYQINIGTYSTKVTSIGNVDIIDSAKYLNFSSNQSLVITAIDSRGLTTSASRTVIFLPYSSPSIVGLSKRVNNYGSVVSYSLIPSFSLIEGKNKYTVKCTCNQEGDKFTETLRSSSSLITSLQGNLSHSFSNESTYLLIYSITDSFNKTGNLYVTIDVGSFVFFADKAVKGCGVNTFPTVEGLEIKGVNVISEGSYNHTFSAGGGTSGYMYICSIATTGNYQNQYISFDILQRNRYGGIKFNFKSSATSGSLSISNFIVEGNITAAYVNNNNIVDIYIQKSESYDNISLFNLSKGAYMNKTIFTWKNETVTTLPENAVIVSSDSLLKSWPVGSLYLSSVNVSPASFLGGGWEKLDSGYYLKTGVGGTKGGSLTSGSTTLTAAQSGTRAHTHTATSTYSGANFYIRHGETAGTATVDDGTNTSIDTGVGTTWGNGIATTEYSHKIDRVNIRGTVSTTINNSSAANASEGHTHTIDPSRYEIYAWKRIS